MGPYPKSAVRRTAMRLSEAILLGSTIGPQAFGHFFLNDGTCAMGAAALAVGGHAGETFLMFEQHWKWTEEIEAECPACGVSGKIISVIPHLNDIEEWTRERIAEWIAKIEPAEADSPALDRQQTEISGQGPIPAE